jgi:serine/threonine protein kinase
MNRTHESAARLLPPPGLWPDEAPEDVRAFLDQHPELRGDKAAALDLAYDEYCRLVEAGESPDADLFCARFPTFQSSLRRAIQAHEYLAANPGLLEARESIPWPVEGETFLGFRLLRELGRGSFARVFLAAEPDLGDRLVAVKISPHGGTEAQTLGRLDHPNVVKVYAVRQDERSGLTAVCMPYLGGATLEGVLARRGAGASAILDAARAGTGPAAEGGAAPAPHPLLLTGSFAEGVCLLGAQLADALDFLHRRSIYHRDLKPSNVLLCPDGRPMLLDFNLSADPHAGRERLGGTLPYMSPEQVLATFGPERAAAPVDGGSDLFSLGVILFELLTGRQPFGEVPRGTPRPEDCSALLGRQRQGAPALRGLCPTVTPALARVVAACLAFDRERRPRDAAEVAAALRRDLAPHRRLLRRLRSHPRKLAAAAALAATLVAGGAYYEVRQPPRADRLIEQAEQESAAHEPQKAIDDIDRAVLLRPDSPEALAQRARLKLRERLFAGALGDFREANRLRPEPRLQACIAYCFAREGQHRDAVTENEHALDAGFDTPEVHNNLAYSELGLSLLKQAREDLARALDLSPRLPAACHNRLVLLRVELTRGPAPALGEVRAALDLALDACPESAELYADAADLCATAAPRAADDWWDDRAVTHLEHAVRLGLDLGGRPKNPLYIRLRGKQADRFAALVNAPRSPADNVPTARLADPSPGR